jgi:CRISPR/Cas system CSM-associated protein Csm2 small subunit
VLDSPDEIQWHPAMYAAVGFELREDIEDLEMVAEYNLSKEPIRIDILIVKDSDKTENLKNEIGHIMRKYNVLEYKSPKDSMSIDDFYKTVGYACLYKGYGETVDQIPSKEITVTMLRAAYPREMFATLEKEGHEIEERYPGIYYVTNHLPFPVQVIVTKKLSKETHSCLRILTDNADREDVERFLVQAKEINNPGERNNVDSVLQASVSANYELYEEVRRDAIMCQALQELMKDEIDAKVNSAVTNAETDIQINNIKKIMKNFKCTAEQAMDTLEIPQENRSLYMSKL